MTTPAAIMRTLCTVGLLAIMAPLGAAELDAHTYVAVDAEVRELTLEGMAARAALLNGGNGTAEQEAALDGVTRAQINQVYLDNGTTAAAHATYGAKHADEIAEWLIANPAWQQHFDQLASEFDSLSGQLDALMEGN